jgi:hypothetical protein
VGDHPGLPVRQGLSAFVLAQLRVTFQPLSGRAKAGVARGATIRPPCVSVPPSGIAVDSTPPGV